MTDMQLSESDYAEACRIVEIFFATQRYARNEGVQPKRLQNFYAEQLDQTDGDLVARKRANFPSAVVRMIETKHILRHDEKRNVFIPVKPAISRDPEEDKENDVTSIIRAHKQRQMELDSAAPTSKINQTLKAGIDPKSLAPRYKKRRFTEVDESDASANETPCLSPGQPASRTSSPQRLTRPALGPLDGNRRISAPTRLYSPSAQSEASAQMKRRPSVELKQKNKSSIPAWLVTGMNALREKHPDARYKPTSTNDLQCLDCEKPIRVASTERMYPFESHLKGKEHKQAVLKRLDGPNSSRAPVSPAPSIASMPLPSVTMPAMRSFESVGSNGGFLETMIADAIDRTSGIFGAQIRALEKRIESSEQLHNRKLEEMTLICDESSRRNKDLASQIEESRSLADNLSERLAASERRNEKISRLAASMKSLDEVIEVLQRSQESNATQIREASESIKSLEQTVSVLKRSTQRKYEAQEAQMFHVGKQCAATAEDLARHNKTQSDLRQNIVSHIKDQYEKFSRQLATTQTAVNAQKNELHELKQQPLHNAKLDQGSISQLKSQLLAETKTFNENLTSQLKLIEKRISKQAVLFTSLDHGTAEWVNSTQESLGSRMTSLEQSFEQKIKSINLNIGDIHQRAETARGNFQADVRKLREEFTQLLQSNEETINRLDNHQDDRDVSLKASVRNTMQLTEERMAEKMSLLQASYERVDKSLSDLENNLSLGLNTTMEGHIHNITMKHTELANTIQHGQQELSQKLNHDLQERIDRERQHQAEETKTLIQEYTAKRDSELAAKYEEQFKPLILKFMVDQSESLKKGHEEQMESSFKTQLQEREQQLERKYEESFKPMIAKFITDQQRELREENEARIQSLLEKHADELSKVARQHSAVESEEDLRSLVLRIVKEEGGSLGGASDEQMRAELGCLEEATQERILSLKQTLEARCQQLDDFDALLPYLLADVDALRKRISKAGSGHVMVKKRRASSSA
ncbi:hypothetical protein CJF32_00001983 [Rutstroemia sp. NJR-2017a WRK4]|nr:hypothetical protein CJF32_00001983 [Rutstroemia sp. NJR-2017a WRK4]